MAKNPFFDDISLTPFSNDLLNYNSGKFLRDVNAAISVAMLTIPQAMAYALVAGLPLYCGLFAAIFAPMIAALFGSSRQIVVGPSNAIAILIQSGTAQILMQYYGYLSGFERGMAALAIMTQLTLLVGLLHLIATGFKLGNLTQFVSYSVVTGYVSGAAVAIIVSQLYLLVGIPTPNGMHSIFMKGYHLITHLHEIHWMTALLGISSFGLIYSLRRINRRIPAAVITFAIMTLIVLSFDTFINQPFFDVTIVGDTGKISDLRPTFQLPSFDARIMNNLLPIAFAVALLSILETTSVAKSIASNTGQRLSTNQEIFGLGLGNLTSAFVGAMPVSGSTSRSTMNYENGAQTRFAAVFGAIAVGAIVFLFGDVVMHIPLTALAALMLLTSMNVVRKRNLLLCMKSTSADSWVFWLTFLATIFFSLDIAFYIGVGLSITLYLKKAATPHLQQYTFDENGKLKSLSNVKKDEEVVIRIIKVKGELFFGAADLFQTTLKAIAGKYTQSRVIILQLKNARDIDATSCLAIRQLHEFLHGSGRRLICTGLTLPVWEVFSGSGLIDLIGKENLFLIEDHDPHAYMDKAMVRAQELADETKITVEEEIEENTGSIVTEPTIQNLAEKPST